MILLSFDIEEFDVPAVEYGMPFSFEEQMDTSIRGTRAILSVLKNKHIKATFFCTANFAIHAPKIVQQIVAEGHELASHGYYHSSFKNEDYKKSKTELERIGNTKIKGFRMARMMPVNYELMQQAGYTYDSSLNPTFIPGRYNHLTSPKTVFSNPYVTILPSSVTPLVRFPLFWLSFHNIPLKLFKWLSQRTLAKHGYLNIYFHPWEFVSLHDATYGLPFYFKNKSGDKMVQELGSFIDFFKSKDVEFNTISHFLKHRKVLT